MLAPPGFAEVRRLVHALREPVGAFAIYLALLDDDPSSGLEREHLAAMLRSVERMTHALTEITRAFGLEVSTPLSLLGDAEERRDRREHRDRPRLREAAR